MEIPEDSRIKTDGRFLKETALTPERLKQISRVKRFGFKKGSNFGGDGVGVGSLS
jgi:L-glyceraldehyde 3-phosphate reductase